MRPALHLDSLDNRHIILDVGLLYTKCGFAKDPTPMHIIPTPSDLVQNIRENLKDVSDHPGCVTRSVVVDDDIR